MTVPLPRPPLLLITDRRRVVAGSVEGVVVAAFEAGCRWVMVREKDLAAAALTAFASRLVGLARHYRASVLVNGDAAVAAAAGAAGVHLQAGADVGAARRALGPRALIGVSTHTPAEAEAAAQAGADYVTFSPVFATASKPGYGPTDESGLARLAAVAGGLSLPVIALAGVTAANASACLAAGAAGIAVMGPVMGAADPAAVVRELIAALGMAAG